MAGTVASVMYELVAGVVAGTVAVGVAGGVECCSGCFSSSSGDFTKEIPLVHNLL